MTDKSINEVIKNKDLLAQINEAGITTLEELCTYSKKKLVEKGIANLYVKDIMIALQSEGLDLKKR